MSIPITSWPSSLRSKCTWLPSPQQVTPSRVDLAIRRFFFVGSVGVARRTPYTRKLMASILDPGARRSAGKISTIPGGQPTDHQPAASLLFFDRCEEQVLINCPSDRVPALVDVSLNHQVRCFREHNVVQPPRREGRR